RSERSMHSVRSRGRRHRKRRLVRELGGSRQGKHPWWFSPDDRDWLCSPDRSRRCVSLHMLVTAAEFLLGPIPGNPAWFEGRKAENRAGCGGVFRAESRSDEV